MESITKDDPAWLKKHLILILTVLLSLVFILKIALVGKGAFSGIDEFRYINGSIRAIEYLSAGQFNEFATSLFSTHGRPGDVLVRLIPAAIQYAAHFVFGWNLESRESLIIPQIFNTLISLLLIILFYKVCLRIFSNNRVISLSASVFFALLINNNIYIRHIFPYDLSMVCFLAALLISLREESINNRKYNAFIIAGICTGLGFAIYPGYYVFTAIIFGSFFYTLLHSFSKRALMNTAIFFGAVLLMQFFFVASGWLCGVSYIGELKNLTGTINMGTYEEGFAFIIKYLVQVESISGMILILFNVIFFAMLLYKLLQQKNIRVITKLEFLFIIALAGYLYHAVNSVFFQKTVFYGRILHMYFPIMVLALFSTIATFRPAGIRNFCLSASLIAVVIAFISFYVSYLELAYPRDVLYQHNVDTAKIPSDNIVHERYTLFFKPLQPKWHMYSGYTGKEDPTKWIFVNFSICYGPIKLRNNEYEPAPDMKRIFSGMHSQSFPAYMFEGLLAEERKELRENPIIISIYEKQQ